MFNFTFCALSASSLCFPFKEAVVWCRSFLLPSKSRCTHRWQEDREGRRELAGFIRLGGTSPAQTAAAVSGAVCWQTRGFHRGAASLPGLGDARTFGFSQPSRDVSLQHGAQEPSPFFFFFFSWSVEGSTPTTHPHGAGKEPRGSKKRGRLSIVLDFLSLSASFGWQERSLRARQVSSEQLRRKEWEAGSGKSHSVVMWVWKASEKEKAEENISLELNK